MSYEQILSTLGLSQTSLETLLIYGLIAVVVGYVIVTSWQYIIAGLFILGVLFVFSHHKDTEAKVDKEETITKTEKQKFMDDCVSLTEKETMCETLWRERWEE